jgi:hypothetical protein
MLKITIPAPNLQIDFSLALARLRAECLQEALSQTVQQMDISIIDKELALFVPKGDLSGLAGRGLRGELVFAVPCLLEQNPRLLGYYRLLLGFSRKSFYSSDFGTSSFKCMEENGRLSAENQKNLSILCKAIIGAASLLVDGIGAEHISRELLDDLTLLTFGAQLRGGANVKIGTLGIENVFKAIHKIVKEFCLSTSPQQMEIRNAADRKVLIEFAADPDIIIREQIAPEIYRNTIAIEVKSGTDFSNIHNRLGEAEKSHTKARRAGFVECWTVVNVNRINLEKARRESPSTDRFYQISNVISGKGEEYADFRNRIISLTGIPNK